VNRSSLAYRFDLTGSGSHLRPPYNKWLRTFSPLRDVATSRASSRSFSLSFVGMTTLTVL
jgi:hypothetical protein